MHTASCSVPWCPGPDITSSDESEHPDVRLPSFQPDNSHIPIFSQPESHCETSPCDSLRILQLEYVLKKATTPLVTAIVTSLVTRQLHMADGGSSIVAAVMRGRTGVGPCVHASEAHVRVNGVGYVLGTHLPVARKIGGECVLIAMSLYVCSCDSPKGAFSVVYVEGDMRL